MMVCPLIFNSNIKPALQAFAAEWKVGGFLGNAEFINVFKTEVEKLIGAGKVTGITTNRNGIFVQDIFEFGYQKNPANHAGKAILMPTVLDCPWQVHGLNSYPQSQLLKPDVGLQKGESEKVSGSEFVDETGGDYGGNLEVIPPFQADLPYGQLMIGDNMHKLLADFLLEQKVQAKGGTVVVTIPVNPQKGSVVFHVDEVCNVVPSTKDKKFKIVIGDIDLAIKLIKASTVKELKPLRDKYISTKKEDLAKIKAIRDQLAAVRAALIKDGGLAPGDIVAIPVLYPFAFREGYGLPNAVNLQVIYPSVFIPDPIYDKDKGTVFIPMQKEISKILVDAGVPLKDLKFVNTSQMTGSGGEAHCATQVERKSD
jgi:hypothetical protein